jgi:hypothetical protein
MINFPNKVEFCLNNTVDGTTGQNARDPIPINETNNGWIPFGRKPSRQSQNQLFFEHGNWTTYLKDTFEPFQNNINSMLLDKTNGLGIPTGSIFSTGDTILSVNSGVREDTRIIMNEVVSSSITTNTKYFNVTDTAATFNKDALVDWADSVGGGGRATPLTDDNWVYIYAIGKDDGDVNFAIDDNEDGTNVIANIIDVVTDYKWIKLILTVPWVNNGGIGSRFTKFKYKTDNFVEFGSEVTEASQSFAETNTTGVIRNLVLPISGLGAMPGTPTNQSTYTVVNAPVRLQIRVPATSLDTGVVASGMTNPYTANSEDNSITVRAGEAVIVDYHITSEQNPDYSQILTKSLGGASADIQVGVIGFYNPCTYKGMINSI